MKDEYLISLVGRSVQVYKGGPDSNVGVLLDVNDDYLTLQKEDGEIIYYKTAHIKSIKENSQIRFNSILRVYDSNYLVKAAKFNEVAGHFKDQIIQINGKGPESKFGTLIDVKDDFFVLHTEQDGLIFYKEQHIKSFSHAIPKTNNVDVKDEEVKVEETLTDEATEDEAILKMNEIKDVYDQITADNTNGLLKNLTYSWIKINRKGPESIEGLLTEANDEYLVMVVNNEIFRIANYHVKNFSLNINKSEEKKTEEENAKQTEEENAQQTKSKKGKESDGDQETSKNSSKKDKESDGDQETSKKSSKNGKQSDGNQESSTYTSSTYTRLTYEEELYLAMMRRNKRMKRKAQKRKK
ncbi:hypothetical protein HMPREF1210_02330 [Paenisporosarcina sp. HGH0030]|uniref:hypothetical protein n=1 Tax=Paenisporosarcina sp. HGH0030 TaxID=1078085 RepID=UPI00034E4D9C|nr:hypothetical protein [Paenisporosarcina sp. HGH0030]EPD50822.1 hypothetical protein HMPREF1210_02330 [Paenisporosarcina sp. HGH0030]